MKPKTVFIVFIVTSVFFALIAVIHIFKKQYALTSLYFALSFGFFVIGLCNYRKIKQ